MFSHENTKIQRIITLALMASIVYTTSLLMGLPDRETTIIVASIVVLISIISYYESIINRLHRKLPADNVLSG